MAASETGWCLATWSLEKWPLGKSIQRLAITPAITPTVTNSLPYSSCLRASR